MSDQSKTRDDEEHNEVGLGGSTGGGMLGGGSPTDAAEGRSAFHADEESSDENDDESSGRFDQKASDVSHDEAASRTSAIAHDPANNTGTTDAGLSSDSESRSVIGGLISGGLPVDNDAQ